MSIKPKIVCKFCKVFLFACYWSKTRSKIFELLQKLIHILIDKIYTPWFITSSWTASRRVLITAGSAHGWSRQLFNVRIPPGVTQQFKMSYKARYCPFLGWSSMWKRSKFFQLLMSIKEYFVSVLPTYYFDHVLFCLCKSTNKQ